MKFLKILLIIIVALIALFLIINAFMPGDMKVERSITINAPAVNAFVLVNDLKNWERWSPWNELDPNMKMEYGEIIKGVGASYSWTSEHEQVGIGRLKIAESQPNSLIKTELYFMEDDGDPSHGTWKFEENEGASNVTWTMEGTMPFLMRIMVPMMEAAVGEMFDQGLENIKNIAETMSADVITNYEITEEMVESTPYYFIADSVFGMDSALIANKMGSAFGEIMAFTAQNKIEMAGMPMSVTVAWSEDPMSWNFRAGVPVKSTDVAPTGRIKKDVSYAGKAIKTIHIGPYSESEYAYKAMMEYLNRNNLETNGFLWEVYANDPGEVPPEEYETHIYFPIKQKE